MPQGPTNRRIGVVKQRLSDEECPYPGTSSELLSTFLKSVDFNVPKPPRSWECNPLYKQLRRRLQGTIQMAQVEEILWEKYRQAIMGSYPSVQSTMTMSSTQSVAIRDSDVHQSFSTADSMEEQLLWIKQTAQARKDALRCYSVPPSSSRKETVTSEIVPEDPQPAPSEIQPDPPAKQAKEGLASLEGIWKLRWDEPVHMLDLCKSMDLEKSEIDRREEHLRLEISFDGPMLCVRSEIFGLYNVDIPLSGETRKVPRIDRHDGVMSAHIENKRKGLRMIYTWDHPAAGTRRDNYEISENGKNLVLNAYVTLRGGHYCKIKWRFEKSQ